jgi:UDP:flavonoid glycosyltransferase YjiC (YdhE family)
MAHSVAVVNFEPNAGHVLPLLRIAAAFSARGYEVTCHLPAECEKLLDDYPFRFVSLGQGHERARVDQTLGELSRRSVFYNAFSNYADLSESVLEPLKAKMHGQLPTLTARLAEQRPLFMLSDTHNFQAWYVKLAHDAKIPLVLHITQGLRYHQDLYVQTYGMTSLPRPLQAGVELLGRASRRGFCALNGTRTPGSDDPGSGPEGTQPDVSTPAYRAAEREAVVISTGCAYLERKYLRSSLRDPGRPPFFGPLKPSAASGMSPELKAWLAADNKSVVYVSFGSMIQPAPELAKSLLAAATRLNVRVLWSMPKDQQDALLPQLEIPSSARFETSVPPLEVLALPNVRCAVNHGGAGSIQDCALSGKPMLCIPFMWDQPFNASVVSALGIGVRLWKRKASAAGIQESVGKLLEDAAYARRAADIAQELQADSTGASVVEYVLGQPAIAARLQSA